MRYVIGVDGGGTKTAFALADPQGNILAQTVLPSISYREHGLDAVCARLQAGVQVLLSDAGVELSQVASAAVGAPGYGENAVGDAALAKTVEKAFYGIPTALVNDAQVACYGALSGRAGINIVAGTGSIAYGEDGKGGSARSGGWSEHFSDEGSCYWLGKMTMGLFCKEADGRAPKGALYHILCDTLSLRDDMSFISVMEAEYLPVRSKVAGLQRYLLRAARQGDSAAKGLYEDACRELTQLAVGIRAQLNFDGIIPVSLTGGLTHAGALVEAPLAAMLAREGMEYLRAEGSPLAGAVLLARKNLV